MLKIVYQVYYTHSGSRDVRSNWPGTLSPSRTDRFPVPFWGQTTQILGIYSVVCPQTGPQSYFRRSNRHPFVLMSFLSFRFIYTAVVWGRMYRYSYTFTIFFWGTMWEGWGSTEGNEAVFCIYSYLVGYKCSFLPWKMPILAGYTPTLYYYSTHLASTQAGELGRTRGTLLRRGNSRVGRGRRAATAMVLAVFMCALDAARFQFFLFFFLLTNTHRHCTASIEYVWGGLASRISCGYLTILKRPYTLLVLIVPSYGNQDLRWSQKPCSVPIYKDRWAKYQCGNDASISEQTGMCFDTIFSFDYYGGPW